MFAEVFVFKAEADSYSYEPHEPGVKGFRGQRYRVPVEDGSSLLSHPSLPPPPQCGVTHGASPELHIALRSMGWRNYTMNSISRCRPPERLEWPIRTRGLGLLLFGAEDYFERDKFKGLRC